MDGASRNVPGDDPVKKVRTELVMPRRQSLGERISTRMLKFTRQDKAKSRQRIRKPEDGSDKLEDIRIEALNEYVELLHEGEVSRAIYGLRAIRKLLSKIIEAPIQQVIDAQVIPMLVEYLGHDNEEAQLEASWCLTNITSGTSPQTQVVVDAGGLEWFVQHVQSPNSDIRELAIWALGNISADSSALRQAVINTGVIPLMVERLVPSEKKSLLRIAAWTMLNICNGRPRLLADVSRVIAPSLVQLMHSDDDELIANASLALSHILRDVLDIVTRVKLIPRMVELLQNPTRSVILGNLQIAGKLLSMAPDFAEPMQKADIVEALHPLLRSQWPDVRKEACWVLSGIASGPVPVIQSVIDENVFGTLVTMMSREESVIKLEICWVFVNATVSGSKGQRKILLRLNCIQLLLDELRTEYLPDTLISGILHAFINILLDGRDKTPNRYAELFTNVDFSPVLESIDRNNPAHQLTEQIRLLCRV
mmetsp:Transcript_23996/g.44523  ORF Transcript_23996/g.44523 Transcript_23996/m.44523 type:complete len:480 (+) Transcript_23996:175-1614(+)